MQSDKTFAEIAQTINRHLADRNWTDSPSRDLAISISLEANELLEHYQWQEKPVGTPDELAEELADILIYAFQFAESNGIDIAAAITAKLAKAARKYPAELFQNKDEKANRQAWIAAKLSHKKDGL